jgi:glycosyltransferase involved in cell wall biosynthesis
MIVKNEMANLERCLVALAPHIDCWVIGDTGSSDGTQDFVMSFFAARGLPGELHSFQFENFEQARNTALDYAYASPLAYDYLLFCDADMELVVDDTNFRERLTAAGYRLIQRTAGGLTYWNARLARRDVGARYYGVTHEYLDVPIVNGARTGTGQPSLLVLSGSVLQGLRSHGRGGRHLRQTRRDGRLGGGGVVCSDDAGAVPA